MTTHSISHQLNAYFGGGNSGSGGGGDTEFDFGGGGGDGGGGGGVVASTDPLEWLEQAEEALETAGIVVRKLDKKRERQATFALKQALLADLQGGSGSSASAQAAADDPGTALLLVAQIQHLKAGSPVAIISPCLPASASAAQRAASLVANAEAVDALVSPLIAATSAVDTAAVNDGDDDMALLSEFQATFLSFAAQYGAGGGSGDGGVRAADDDSSVSNTSSNSDGWLMPAVDFKVKVGGGGTALLASLGREDLSAHMRERLEALRAVGLRRDKK